MYVDDRLRAVVDEQLQDPRLVRGQLVDDPVEAGVDRVGARVDLGRALEQRRAALLQRLGPLALARLLDGDPAGGAGDRLLAWVGPLDDSEQPPQRLDGLVPGFLEELDRPFAGERRPRSADVPP